MLIVAQVTAQPDKGPKNSKWKLADLGRDRIFDCCCCLETTGAVKKNRNDDVKPCNRDAIGDRNCRSMCTYEGYRFGYCGTDGQRNICICSD